MLMFEEHIFIFFSNINGIDDYQYISKDYIILSTLFAFAFGWIIESRTGMFEECPGY